MATLSDLKEVKEALDAGLVSQAEFDEVKREYLRAKKECQKLELQAKKEALEANREFQKKELEFQKRELHSKEAFQQKKSEADLRAYALESIVKHGSSIMSEEQKADLVRDYAKMSGLDGSAEKCARASKRQRTSANKRDASPPQPPTPPAPADTPAPVVANQARVLASRGSKRFRTMSTLVKEKEAAAAAIEYSNYSDDDGEDESDYDELSPGKRCQKKWTEDEDVALVAALRAGQRVRNIKIGGRSAGTANKRLWWARKNGSGGPALREYLEETCPEYVYKGHPKGTFGEPWSSDEDQTFIQAHREGKTLHEIAAMLPGRTYDAVKGRWYEAKLGKARSAALRAYAAECCKG